MTNAETYAEPAVVLPNDVSMPLLGFGTWQLRGSQARDATRWALDAGYRHIDTATGYGNQSEVGAALRDSGVPREDVFLTTKLPPDHVGRETRTLQESLTELGTDHLDLWLIHWPPGGTAGVESWRAFSTALDEGLTRSIGVSNYSIAQIDELTERVGVTPAVNQIKWNPFLYKADVVAAHRERGVVIEGYSPFRAANLTDATLGKIAAAHGKTPAQVILRWHIRHGFVVIPKSAHVERIESNADIFDFELSDEDIAALDALAR